MAANAGDKHKPWSTIEDQVVIDMYEKGDPEEMLKLLTERTWGSIKQRAHKLKINRPRAFQFSNEMFEHLINNYATTTDLELSKFIGCTICMVRTKCKNIGLKKDPEFILAMNKSLGKKLGEAGAGYRFEKGHVPGNKGKKIEEFMSPEVVEKFKANQFVKGQKPKNWLPVGSEVITRDGYVQVKVAEGMFQWRLKHRITWEKHNGPIPKGCNVQFRDSNPLNCDDITNLYLISKAKQCRDQNSIQRYPADVKKAIRTLGKLNKQIRNYETDKHRCTK